MEKCKYEGTGVWDGRCVGTKEVDPCPGYDKCKQYKPNYTSNADHIRSMNDEELAKWIDWLFGRCEWCDTDKIATDDCNDVECTPCILKWLQQPAVKIHEKNKKVVDK